MEALWIVLVVLLAGGGIAFSLYLKKKRREEMATFARQNGLQYSAHDPFQTLGWPFGLFQKGDGRGVENVVWGPWQGGSNVTAFDYWYYTETTDSKGHRSRSYHRFSCATIEVAAAFPHLEIAREGFFTRMADHMGMEDIEFESPEFNRRYNVKAKERRFAYELLDARMLEWLVGFDQGYAFEILGNRILAYGRRTKASGLTPLLGTLTMFRDRVPRVAWTLYPLGR
ncbi:MAG: hypothetical protein ACRDJP_00030 [Actinomycetota bacterium]